MGKVDCIIGLLISELFLFKMLYLWKMAKQQDTASWTHLKATAIEPEQLINRCSNNISATPKPNQLAWHSLTV